MLYSAWVTVAQRSQQHLIYKPLPSVKGKPFEQTMIVNLQITSVAPPTYLTFVRYGADVTEPEQGRSGREGKRAGTKGRETSQTEEKENRDEDGVRRKVLRK